jgi:hypothetical protein
MRFPAILGRRLAPVQSIRRLKAVLAQGREIDQKVDGVGQPSRQ